MIVPEPLLRPRPEIEFLAHQEQGVRWMMSREAVDAPICRGGILGDDMGLGKTFQTIGLLRNGLPLRTLIICPPALIAGWTEELRSCGYVVSVLVGAVWTSLGSKSQEKEGDTGLTTVWLTSYPKACMYRREIATRVSPFERIVLDEGHVIRNGKATSRWMSCMAIGRRAVCRWILSATPVQNGFSDWRNLCWWLRVRCPSGDIPDLGPVLMLRRTMEELRGIVQGLPVPPSFIEHNLVISAVGEEGKLFHTLCDQFAGTGVDIGAVSALLKLELYMRIQQFLVHPQIYIDSMRAKMGRGAYTRADWSGSATKWEACMVELAIGISAGDSQIVFCQFRSEMDKVAFTAERMGATVFSVRGGMGVEEVGRAVREGREAAGRGEAVVMVIQIVSGGAGLNLQFCSRILFLSLHWNPAVVHQAVGRAVRIGQKRVVQIHLFSIVDDVVDNIDRRMSALHGVKIAGAREICSSLFAGFHTGHVLASILA